MDRTGSERPERQTALVAKELGRYNIDIAALNETRLSCYDSMEDCGYTFFWSGREEAERREFEVGFAIKSTIAKLLEENPTPISDRIMTMRLPLDRDVYAPVISRPIYVPTMINLDEKNEKFHGPYLVYLKKTN